LACILRWICPVIESSQVYRLGGLQLLIRSIKYALTGTITVPDSATLVVPLVLALTLLVLNVHGL